MMAGPRPGERGWRPSGLAALAVALAALPALVLPGDAPFINDEPFLVLAALRANGAHHLAELGLVGTKGLPYGPVPTWIYQALLAVTHAPVALVLLHAVLLASGVGLALLWLSRVLGLWPWFAPLALLSPYLWLYERILWDNTFNLPIAALLVAGYADFLARRRPASLALALLCAAAAPLVHLMALALVVPFAAHVVVFERRALRRWPWTLAPAALLVAAAAPYLRALAAAARAGEAAGTGFSSQGLLFPLTGGRLLTATGLDYFLGPAWGGPWLRAAAALSAPMFLLVWAGAARAAVRVAVALRRREATPRLHVEGLALAIVLAQAALDGATRSFRHPHYHGATWIASAVLAWTALDALAAARAPAVRALRWVAWPMGAALAGTTLALLVRLHATGGARAMNYGPALRSELAVVRELRRHPAGVPLETDVENLVRFPHALEALGALEGAPPGPLTPARKVVVRYASPDPMDARVEVFAVPP